MTYKNVTDYTTITAADPLSLEQQVKEMLLDNWQPLGGGFMGTEVSLYRNAKVEVDVWCQTMVLRIPRKGDE